MNYSNKKIFLRHFKRSIKPGKTQTQQHSLNLWRRIKWLRRIFFFSREIDNVKFRRWSCSSFLMCLIPESKYRHSAFILVLLMFNPPTLIGACVLFYVYLPRMHPHYFFLPQGFVDDFLYLFKVTFGQFQTHYNMISLAV